MANLPAPCKRHFIPTFDSFFNETKRRKLNSKQWQEAGAKDAGIRETQSDWGEGERRKLAEDWTQRGKVVSTETKELTEMLTRPKFKAKPVPKSTYQPPAATISLKPQPSIHSKCPAPNPEERHLTLPQPFYFHTEGRGSEKELRRREEMEKRAVDEQKKRQFTAKPMPNFSQSSECSQESRQVTVPEPFSLHSSQRFEERQAFEQRIRKKEEVREKAQAREREERQRQEEAEIRLLRQQTVFKAQPIFRPRPSPLPSQSSQSSSFLSQDWSFLNE